MRSGSAKIGHLQQAEILKLLLVECVAERITNGAHEIGQHGTLARDDEGFGGHAGGEF